MRRSWVLLLAMALVVAACSTEPATGDPMATGRVTAVTGVEVVESFVIEEVDGSSRLFVPGDEFDRSLEDLRGFVVTGSGVIVTYVTAEEGPDVAVKLVRSG